MAAGTGRFQIVLSFFVSFLFTGASPSSLQVWGGTIKAQHAKYVFVVKGKVWGIANQDAAGQEESAGLTVRVTGTLKAGTITISRIQILGSTTTVFFIGALERVSRKSIERVESRFVYPPAEPSSPSATSMVETGGYVSRETMALHLADGVSIDTLLPEESGLSAESVAAQHSLGDQVEIKCRLLPSPVSEYHHGYEALEVESIRSLRPATKEELFEIAGSHPFGFAAGDNLLTGAPGWISPPNFDMPRIQADGNEMSLERIRAANFQYAREMPNFIAHEKAEAFASRTTNQPQWKLQYAVDSEVTVRGGGENRRNIRKNGKSWTQPGLPDFLTYGAWFELGIRQLLDPRCSSTFEAAGTEQERGTRLLAFEVNSPGGCFTIAIGYQTFRPKIRGRALVEAGSGRLVRFEYEALEFPAAFPLSHWNWMTLWDHVRIGDGSYLVPVRSELAAVYSNAFPEVNRTIRIAREYQDYRHFEASFNVKF